MNSTSRDIYLPVTHRCGCVFEGHFVYRSYFGTTLKQQTQDFLAIVACCDCLACSPPVTNPELVTRIDLDYSLPFENDTDPRDRRIAKVLVYDKCGS